MHKWVHFTAVLWEVGLGQITKKHSCGAKTAEKYRAREAMEKTKIEQVISTILIQCLTLKLKNAPENFPTLPPQKNSSSLTISNTTSGPARSDSSLSEAELDKRYRSTERDHQVGSARRKQVPEVRALLLRRTCWNFFLIHLVSAYKCNRAVGTVFTFRAYQLVSLPLSRLV